VRCTGSEILHAARLEIVKNVEPETSASVSSENVTGQEALNFYRLPPQHHNNLKSTNMLARLMEEIKRRTLVVRIFPNAAACLRLVRALAVATHENWIEAMQYVSMEPLCEQKKEALRKLGDAA
jgi:transposase-like protein